MSDKENKPARGTVPTAAPSYGPNPAPVATVVSVAHQKREKCPRARASMSDYPRREDRARTVMALWKNAELAKS